MSYNSDFIFLFVLLVWIAVIFGYVQSNKAKEKERLSATYVLTGKDIGRVMAYGMVVGLFCASGAFLDRVARHFDNFLLFFIPLAILTLLFVIIERKVATPFLNKRKVMS